MTDFLTKQRKAFILTFTVMIIILTSIFVITESKLDLNLNDLHSFILNDEALTTVQSEEHYRGILQNHKNEIFILKNDTTIEFATNTWRNNFGYQKENIKGNNFFTLIHPEDLPFFANEMIELINTEKIINGIGPFRLKDNEGQYHLYIADGIPLTNHDGKIVRIGLILIDVSAPLGE